MIGLGLRVLSINQVFVLKMRIRLRNKIFKIFCLTCFFIVSDQFLAADFENVIFLFNQRPFGWYKQIDFSDFGNFNADFNIF